MTSLEEALLIAVRAHNGQKDKAEAPYILHPLRVMFRMHSEVEMTVAVLHDVLEDSEWTLHALREQGFSEEVLAALDHLTKREGESYGEFIERVRRNSIACRVKLADLEDNMDVKRLRRLAKKDVLRLRTYHTSWQELSGS